MDKTHIKGYIPVRELSEEEKARYYKKRQQAIGDAMKRSPLSAQRHAGDEPELYWPQEHERADQRRVLPPPSEQRFHLSERFRAEKAYAQTPADIQNATIRITSEYFVYQHEDNPTASPDISSATGSGCYIQHRNNEGGIDDRIITNAHVVCNTSSLFVQSHAHPARYRAIIEHVCPEADIAILHVLEEEGKEPFFSGLKPFKFCDNPWEFLSVDQYMSLTTHGYSLGNDYTKTNGHVTSIEAEPYANSLQKLPVIRTDAAISPGNSGGPATIFIDIDGRSVPHLIGVVFQSFLDGQNINSLIPIDLVTKVIEDRLKPLDMRGIPHIAMSFEKVQNQALREYVGARDNQGILVTAIPPLSCAHGYLQEGDLLLEINGVPISERGMIDYPDRPHLSFLFEYVFKSLGDEVSFKVQRHGQILHEKIPLTRRFLEEVKVRRSPQNKAPTFFVVSGLVFSIEQLCDSYESSTEMLLDYSQAVKSLKQSFTDEVVNLAMVLPHMMTEHYDHLVGATLVSLNGKEINNIVELVNAVDAIDDHDTMIFELKLDNNVKTKIVIPKISGSELQNLLQKYQIFADRSLHLSPSRIGDYFAYQASDAIAMPSRYMRIFHAQGPFAAMMDNHLMRSFCEQEEESAIEHDRSESPNALAEELRPAAQDTLAFLKDLFNHSEIVFLLQHAIEQSKNLPQESEYQQILTALCLEAASEQALRERFFCGGLTQKKQQENILKKYRDTISDGLSLLMNCSSNQSDEEAKLHELIAFCVSPLLATQDDIARLQEEYIEDESSVAEEETLCDEDDDLDSRIDQSKDDPGSLEDFIEDDSDHGQGYVITKSLIEAIRNRPRLSFTQDCSTSNHDNNMAKSAKKKREDEAEEVTPATKRLKKK